MSCVFRFWFAFALGLALMAGCSDENGGGGSGGSGGTGGMGGTGGTGGMGGTGGTEPACQGTVCACSEAGIRAAIAEGGGPFTFDCDGPTTVVTEAEIVIDNDVILDGGGKLTVDGSADHPVFVVPPSIPVPGVLIVELRGFTITGGKNAEEECFPEPWRCSGGGVYNGGTLTLTDSTVHGNTSISGGGIYNEATLTLEKSVVRDNRAEGAQHSAVAGGGIYNGGTLTLIDSTVSNNSAFSAGGGVANIFGATATLTGCTVSRNAATLLEYGGGGGISNDGYGTMTLVNSTVSENSSPRGGAIINSGTLTLMNSTLTSNGTEQGGDVQTEGGSVAVRNSLIDSDCSDFASGTPDVVSLGNNIESPGNTCGFDTNKGDLFDVTAEQLNLGPLEDDGGPTMTHALLPGSVAIDKIPEADCEVTTDQRGVARPQGPACDVGAFELEVAP
jgi:hypothetical protein